MADVFNDSNFFFILNFAHGLHYTLINSQDGNNYYMREASKKTKK